MNEKNMHENQDPEKTPLPAYYGEPVREAAMPGEIDMARLLRLLREKWITIAAVLIFSFVAAELYLLVAEKIYRAVSLVELAVRRPRIAGQQGAVIDDAYNNSQSEEIFNTWLERFKSRTMLELAMKQLRSSGEFSQWSDEELRNLLNNPSIVLIRRSRLVRISFDNSDSRFAAAAANAFADAAVDWRMRKTRQRPRMP